MSLTTILFFFLFSSIVQSVNTLSAEQNEPAMNLTHRSYAKANCSYINLQNWPLKTFKSIDDLYNSIEATTDIISQNFSQTYTNRTFLGSGSYGLVYKFTNTIRNQSVAIKFMLTDEDAKFEIKILSFLKPLSGVIKLHSYGIEGDVTFMEMNLISRKDGHECLGRWINKNRLPYDQTLMLFFQIVQTVARLHYNNIAHNDIKVELDNMKLIEGLQYDD